MPSIIFEESSLWQVITELTALMAEELFIAVNKQTLNIQYAGHLKHLMVILFITILNHLEKGHCIFCGARKNWDRVWRSHAYQFIHTKNPDSIFNMKFDVIIEITLSNERWWRWSKRDHHLS